MYLDGTLYSFDTMMLMCIGVVFTGVGVLYANMLYEDNKEKNETK
jgi:hypothetical protein